MQSRRRSLRGISGDCTMSSSKLTAAPTTASIDEAPVTPGALELPLFEPYESPAGGWGALQATAKALREQSVVLKGGKSLLAMNQPDGFDCPGCAWPDPKHTSSFKFCENGAKAVAFELTSRRVTRDFFAAHTVRELEQHRADRVGGGLRSDRTRASGAGESGSCRILHLRT